MPRLLGVFPRGRSSERDAVQALFPWSLHSTVARTPQFLPSLQVGDCGGGLGGDGGAGAVSRKRRRRKKIVVSTGVAIQRALLLGHQRE